MISRRRQQAIGAIQVKLQVQTKSEGSSGLALAAHPGGPLPRAWHGRSARFRLAFLWLQRAEVNVVKHCMASDRRFTPRFEGLLTLSCFGNDCRASGSGGPLFCGFI